MSSCLVTIATYFSRASSQHLQSVFQSTTFRPGCPSHLQVLNRKRKYCQPIIYWCSFLNYLEGVVRCRIGVVGTLRPRGQESWLGRGHRISQHTCTCCTIMLHASCADAEVAFEYIHVECTAWIGNVVSLRLCTSKIFSSCALQTFLIPLTHPLAKVPPSAVLAFSRSSPSPSLFALVDPSAQIAWTARETERLTSMFGFCAEHRQGSSPSVLSRGVLQQSGILVVWSHFRPSNVVLKSIDSTSHTVRQIDCCTAFVLRSCSVVQVRQQLISELGSRGYSW